MSWAGSTTSPFVVPDIEEAKRFYTETLGMTIEREGYNDQLGVALAFFRPVAGEAMTEAMELRGAQGTGSLPTGRRGSTT